MSDIHIKVLLSRVEMSGPAMRVMGDEGPRRDISEWADDIRSSVVCSHCGGHFGKCYPFLSPGADGSAVCEVRYAEMRKARR